MVSCHDTKKVNCLCKGGDSFLSQKTSLNDASHSHLVNGKPRASEAHRMIWRKRSHSCLNVLV